MEKMIKIKNRSGIHARPAGILVKEASNFESDIEIAFNGRTVNAKSILNIMALAIKSDAEIKLIVNGDDEQEAMNKISTLIENDFKS